MSKKLYQNDSERVAAFRARNKKVQLNVDISEDLFQRLNVYLAYKGYTKSFVISRLIETQLLRKR